MIQTLAHLTFRDFFTLNFICNKNGDSVVHFHFFSQEKKRSRKNKKQMSDL